MSTKLGGAGAGRCDACGRVYSWGCGHSGSQEYAARKHNATRAHRLRRCRCYGHDYCDPKTCKLAKIRIPGYVPFHQHTPEPSREPLVLTAHEAIKIRAGHGSRRRMGSRRRPLHRTR